MLLSLSLVDVWRCRRRRAVSSPGLQRAAPARPPAEPAAARVPLLGPACPCLHHGLRASHLRLTAFGLDIRDALAARRVTPGPG